jgi:hypothetical protein
MANPLTVYEINDGLSPTLTQAASIEADQNQFSWEETLLEEEDSFFDLPPTFTAEKLRKSHG